MSAYNNYVKPVTKRITDVGNCVQLYAKDYHVHLHTQGYHVQLYTQGNHVQLYHSILSCIVQYTQSYHVQLYTKVIMYSFLLKVIVYNCTNKVLNTNMILNAEKKFILLF